MSASDIVTVAVWTTLGVVGTGAAGVALQGIFAKPEKEANIARVYSELLRDSENARLKLQKKNSWLQRQHDKDVRRLADRDEILKLFAEEMSREPCLSEKLAGTLKAVQKIINGSP